MLRIDFKTDKTCVLTLQAKSFKKYFTISLCCSLRPNNANRTALNEDHVDYVFRDCSSEL